LRMPASLHPASRRQGLASPGRRSSPIAVRHWGYAGPAHSSQAIRKRRWHAIACVLALSGRGASWRTTVRRPLARVRTLADWQRLEVGASIRVSYHAPTYYPGHGPPPMSLASRNVATCLSRRCFRPRRCPRLVCWVHWLRNEHGWRPWVGRGVVRADGWLVRRLLGGLRCGRSVSWIALIDARELQRHPSSPLLDVSSCRSWSNRATTAHPLAKSPSVVKEGGVGSDTLHASLSKYLHQGSSEYEIGA
jgi:hypothetical protein